MSQLKEYEEKKTDNLLALERKDRCKELIRCLSFAAEAHKDQKRKDFAKTPYINHPIGVAYIISEEAGLTNLNLLESGLLHDTVEDTSVSFENIRITFGNSVCNIVQEVTDDKTLPKQERKNLQVLHAKSTSPQGKIVKLADKLYNLRDLEKSLPLGWTEERRNEYFLWAFQVCEGLRGVCPELEEKLDDIFKTKRLFSQFKANGQTNPQEWPLHDELKPLICSANFAAEKHSKSVLFGGKQSLPYINHVFSVALIVSEQTEIEDCYVVTAALLLDLVDKTDTRADEIILKFGERVGYLLTEMSCECSNSTEEKLTNLVTRVSGLSHYSKVIVLATIIDISRRISQLTLLNQLPPELETCLALCSQLRTLLTGTLPRLEEDFDKI